VVPSLQIARALVARGHAPESVELYGSRRGQEATVWPPLEFPFTLLPGRGIRRSLAPRALWDNAGAVLGLCWAVVRAVGSFAVRRPRVVVVVGGYASLAAGVAAVVVRAPLVLVHIDAVPGAVNGLLTRFAAANTVSFPGMALPHSTLTGTPVRPDFNALDRSEAGRREAKRELGLVDDHLLLVATGGSLGARRINAAVAEVAARWEPPVPVTIYQITGRRDYAQFASGVASAGSGLDYRLIEFEERMPLVFQAADLFVCRAGANTVAELSVSGVPSLLVPLPGAPRDHQTRNARALEAEGAAIVIVDEDCTGDRLLRELPGVLFDADRLAAMGAAAREAGRPDAAELVAEVVDACAH
jgi:UDP-N-acetylglucosamine--N-acetylmuramyl-(pentapeptide) pyrophosphoryl-undecaprenol N-acetylglucosamine transferase